MRVFIEDEPVWLLLCDDVVVVVSRMSHNNEHFKRIKRKFLTEYVKIMKYIKVTEKNDEAVTASFIVS